MATKFDLVVSEVLFDIAGGDTQLYETARDTAHAKYEESRRSLFRGKLRDVPVETVSSTHPLMRFAWTDTRLILFHTAKRGYDGLIERLITMTHKLVMADSRNTSMLAYRLKRGRKAIKSTLCLLRFQSSRELITI